MTSRLIQASIASAVVVVGAALVGSSFATGCGTQCDRNPNEPPQVWDGGITVAAGTPAAAYESSAFQGQYLDFPPGRTYRFNHKLGGCPITIQTWGSFNPFPVAEYNTNPREDGGIVPDRAGTALLPGNQATVERITATTFDVRNDTCSDVFLRVTASNPDFSPDKNRCPSLAKKDAGAKDAAPPPAPTNGEATLVDAAPDGATPPAADAASRDAAP